MEQLSIDAIAINKAKDELQKKVLKVWHSAGKIGTAQLCTGAGKTRIAVMAVVELLRDLPEARILVLTPTEVIRDTVIPEEFKKWGYDGLLDKITVECIQTSYKTSGDEYDLVIADEVHNYMSEQFELFFMNNIVHRVLGLSAWIPMDKRDKIQEHAPIFYTLTTDQGVTMGIISPYVEYNIPVKMTAVEEGSYASIQRMYSTAESRLGGPLKAFSTAQYIRKRIGSIPAGRRTQDEISQLSAANIYSNAMLKRKTFLYECSSKVLAVRTLLEYLELPNTVIFSQSINFAEAVAATCKDTVAYHSKTAGRAGVMQEFLNGDIKHLSACMAVNEGMDLPKLPYIIIASRVSSPKVHIQRRGRCLRFEEGKTGAVFNLYISGTQDEKWLRTAQATTNYQNIKWINSLKEIVL